MPLERCSLRLLERQLETTVGASSRTTTSAKPPSRLPPIGRWRQLKTSSRKGRLLPSVSRAASPTGCPHSHTSRLSMHPASFTVGRSRPTIQLGSATGLSASPREKDYRLRLLARRLRLLSSRPPVQQSAQSNMISLKNIELMLSSPVWPTTDTVDVSSIPK